MDTNEEEEEEEEDQQAQEQRIDRLKEQVLLATAKHGIHARLAQRLEQQASFWRVAFASGASSSTTAAPTVEAEHEATVGRLIVYRDTLVRDILAATAALHKLMDEAQQVHRDVLRKNRSVWIILTFFHRRATGKQSHTAERH